MIKADFHMHTTFCDGANTPEEMILSAINKGLTTIGLSGHSGTFISKFGMSKDVTHEYFDNIQELKIKYKDKIKALCGIEADLYSDIPPLKFDYIIGSVHYVAKNGHYLGIDISEQIFANGVKEHYNNDFYSYAEDFFDQVKNVVEDTNADIIGHLDLITKFNEGYKYFDETHPRYVKAYKSAVDALVKYNKPFEINTGAISRGYRTFPYPSMQIIQYIKDKGGKFILSSDSHSSGNIAYQFDVWEDRLKKQGIIVEQKIR